MTREQLRTIIEEGLSRIAPEADLTECPAEENLREELDIDSFDFLNFLIGLNDRLGIDIPESDYEKLVSMNDLVDYLEEHLGEQ